MFQPVEGNVDFPAQELAIGRFWKERAIYEKSLAQRADAPRFVFYEGPPTANGLPHPGHCLTRAIKDLFPRYKTMRGFLCERKAGWDTHGLPVEVEVCKEMGIHSKEEIENFGIEPFIHKCQQSVWRYMQEWERLTERIGFWIHLDEAYVTYHQSYVESVWWSLKKLFDDDLLYQGHKIVWWWAQGGTALSAGEVGQGYRQVADPSVYVKFPLLDDDGKVTDTSLLVWTTTPWTLPSNQFVAINRHLDYIKVHDPETNEHLIIAAALEQTLENKTNRHFKHVQTYRGRELVGKQYRPPFDQPYTPTKIELSQSNASVLVHAIESLPATHRPDDETESERSEEYEQHVNEWLKAHPDRPTGWHVVPGNFVSTDTGTGIVHIAPAFGEDDMRILEKERQLLSADGQMPPLINPVAPDGKFTDESPEFCRGRWVKDCDKDIIRDLKQRGLLYHQEQYVHDYPFCWRAEEDPLIQYPRKSWFIRTTKFKDEMLANNAQINWLPEHIKEGRFGKFLETNVDWALSRERFWGTPLPIWVCEKTGEKEAVASYEELLKKPGIQGTEVWAAAKKKNPELSDDLKVHKPYIDAITYDSPFAEGARMERVSEVIDCWYDSGAMPFAQWGWPHRGDTEFREQFPADFISEAIDQTRGWFYSQLAISTLLFARGKAEGGKGTESNPPSPFPLPPYPHPFRNCIVLGLMLGEDGQKMSKSKRNYREPNEIFDRYGADALRWYFFANQPPWTPIRYNEQAIKDSIPEFLFRFWNVYSFFVIYANIDGFEPTGSSLLAPRPIRERSELDRWILSELNRTAAAVVERMDAYDNYGACQQITAFVDALSNWYVRRSRERFWAADKRSPDKLDAYWTLYECLVTTCKIIAPFVPFLAEACWQNLAGAFGTDSPPLQGGARGGSNVRGKTPLTQPLPKGERNSEPPESVHLCDFPTGDPAVIDEALSARMNLVREIASLGRQARTAASLKVRQPLSKVHVVLADNAHEAWLKEHVALLAEELNVKAVDFTCHGDEFINYTIVPNFKRLGPRLGKDMPLVKKLLAEANGAELMAELRSDGRVTLDLPEMQELVLDDEDVEIRLQAKEGWAAAEGKSCVVVLATELTPELISEGLARDLVRVIQDRRKEMGCEYTDRITIAIETDSEEIASAAKKFGDYIQGETLADELTLGLISGKGKSETVDVAGHPVKIHVER